ncbi:dihydrofolate reductase family protein [Streptomyces alkaliterrae]|uniref:Dihydrofolate reductase n=1 Tax=Streptomyces alkaliterrae TaxID=2213162 RepID=A0A5P0YRV5_9ACTN|nr:dihydrofolate reductase family protein [Streptomyces alkaliterrae]MBB1260156.1 dihydrofolate reductase family protein [Streptomyces alkaliterrae]MQS03015.1 dihydrofolate reductase [Streptomyces alkaliterrae]
MRKLVYYVGVSLDGYIAGPGHEVDFFPFGDEKQTAEYMKWGPTNFPETIPTFARDQFGIVDAPNKRFDTVVMGRGTYVPGLEAGFTSPYAHLRQYVVSTTTPRDIDPAVTVVDSDPLGLVRELKKEEGGLDVWLCGGGRLAGVLLPEIDELVIKSYPVIAGSGIPVINGEFSPTLFDVTDRVTFDSGITVTSFARR